MLQRYVCNAQSFASIRPLVLQRLNSVMRQASLMQCVISPFVLSKSSLSGSKSMIPPSLVYHLKFAISFTLHRLHEVTNVVSPPVLTPHPRSRLLLLGSSPRRHYHLHPDMKGVFKFGSPIFGSGHTCATAPSTWRNVASDVLPQNQPYAALGIPGGRNRCTLTFDCNLSHAFQTTCLFDCKISYLLSAQTQPPEVQGEGRHFNLDISSREVFRCQIKIHTKGFLVGRVFSQAKSRVRDFAVWASLLLHTDRIGLFWQKTEEVVS